MNIKKKPSYYPILVDISGNPCLVIGGGRVAYRKVEALLLFNSDITVLSPRICRPMRKLEVKKKIRVIRQYYTKERLKNFKIIFCATDNPLVSKQVFLDCKKENILLNVADVPELCSFILPAVVKRGYLTVSVSTQGMAPFLAKEIRKKVEHFIPPYYADLINLAGKFRNRIMMNKKFSSSKAKERAFRQFLFTDWQKVIKSEGIKKADKYILKILAELEE